MRDVIASPWAKVAAAGLVAVGLELGHVVSRMAELREIRASLLMSSNGSLYNAESLSKAATQLRYFGASAQDATAAVIALQKASVSQDLIPETSLTALRLAQATGSKLSDTITALQKGFGGSSTALIQLDEQFKFLSSEQRASIQDMIEHGKSTQAMGVAMDALREKSSAAAEQIEHGLGPAWHRFITSLGELSDNSGLTGGFSDFITELGTMVKQLTLLADKLNGIKGPENLALKLQVNQSQMDRLSRTLTANPKLQGNFSDFAIKMMRRDFDRLQQERTSLLAQQKAQEDKQSAQTKGKNPFAVDPNSDAAKNSHKLETAMEGSAAYGSGNEPKGDESDAHFIDRHVTQGVQKYKGDGVSLGDPKFLKLTLEDQDKFIAALRVTLTQEAKRLLEARDQKAISTFESHVEKAEGTGPNRLGSSASGIGQFMPQTWLTFYKRLNPTSNLSQSEILAQRDNPTIAKGVLSEATKEYAKVLKDNGQQISAANLYLMHFLGSDGIKVLKNPNTPMDRLGLRNSIFTQNPTYTHGSDGRVLTGREMIDTKLAPKMGETGEDSIVAAQKAIADAAAAAAKRQEETDGYLESEVLKYKEIVDDLAAEKDLTEQGLLNRKRSLAVLNEERSIREKIKSINASRPEGAPEVRVSEDEIKSASEAAGEAFDAQNAGAYAHAARQKYDRPVEQLEKQRTSVTQLIDAYSRLGQGAEVSQLDVQLTEINKKLAEASEEALTFYENIKSAGTAAENGLTEDQLDGLISKLKITKTAGSEVGREFLMTGRQINEDFAGGASNAVGQFFTTLAQGKGIVAALAQSFGQFFSGFLMQIGQAMLKQEMFNALTKRSATQGASGSGGFGGWLSKIVGLAGSAFGGGESLGVSSSISSGTSSAAAYGMSSSSSLTGMRAFHTGGIMGVGSGMVKQASLSHLINAPKFHTGGIMGASAPPLAHDEIGIIGKIGEEVLTADNPRHINNIGKGQPATSQPTVLKNVLVQSPQQLANALAGSHGERVVLNHIAQNAAEVRQTLGV